MSSKWLQEKEGESAPCDKIQIQKLKEDNTLYALYYSTHREAVQKPNSWTYNFVEVSGDSLDSFQTWGFCMDFIKQREGDSIRNLSLYWKM